MIYDREFFVEKGRKGGNSTKKKYGVEALRANLEHARKARWGNDDKGVLTKDTDSDTVDTNTAP